jgi:hypothetical protein
MDSVGLKKLEKQRLKKAIASLPPLIAPVLPMER